MGAGGNDSAFAEPCLAAGAGFAKQVLNDFLIMGARKGRGYAMTAVGRFVAMPGWGW